MSDKQTMPNDIREAVESGLIPVVSDTPKEDRAALEDMRKQPGWHVFQRMIAENISELSIFLSSPGLVGNKPLQEHYSGQLYNMTQLDQLIETRIQRLNAQIQMEELAKQDPNAGSKA